MYLFQIVVPLPDNVTNPLVADHTRLLGTLTSQSLLFGILLGGVIFFGKLVNAGFIYLTSIGDAGKIQSASKEVQNASIGLILVISIFFIVQIMQTVLGIQIFPTNLALPD